MRVVQINAGYNYSSIGRTVTEMHEFFSTHGIESYKFYAIKEKDSEPYDLIGNKLDHKIHGFLSRLFGKQAYFSYFPTKTLIKKLKKIGPDVVILRNFHSNYIHMPSILTFLAKNNIPTIAVLHDCWFYTGHCCHYTEIGCFKWLTECNHCALIHTNNRSWFFDNSRQIFRDKKRLFGEIPNLSVVGVSDWITNESKRAPIFANAKHFQRIYNWIDFKKFYYRDNTKTLKERLGLSSDDFIALGVAMIWDYRKGFELFIDIAEALPDIKIVMVGGLPARQYPANIITVPPTGSTDELAEYYSMADVFLNFSIQESFGKVAAEAMSCGTPVVVNNRTANPEIPGPCGEIVDTCNINSVVEAVKRIRANGKAYYSERCVQRAHELFDKDKNIMQYLELFNRMVKNRDE